MVLSYNNGAQIALGKCRFDLCRTRVFHKPTQIMVVRGQTCCCQINQPLAGTWSDYEKHESRCLVEQTLVLPSPREVYFNKGGENEGSRWLVRTKAETYPMTDEYEIVRLMDSLRVGDWWKVQRAKA